MKLTLHYYGDPILREPAQPVDTIDEAIRELAQAMIRTMHQESGIGLAAQQIGRNTAICVIDLLPEMDVDDDDQRLHPDIAMPWVLINPKIVTTDATAWVREEGCLSFPQITANIQRPWTIELVYRDLDGAEHQRTVSGMLARVVQHEVDHLNGVLFIDRMSHVKKFALKGKLKRLREETRAQQEG